MENWVVYSNFILAKTRRKEIRGFSEKLEMDVSDYRRSGSEFKTSHLKSYLAFLEKKIPI